MKMIMIRAMPRERVVLFLGLFVLVGVVGGMPSSLVWISLGGNKPFCNYVVTRLMHRSEEAVHTPSSKQGIAGIYLIKICIRARSLLFHNAFLMVSVVISET